MYGKSYFNVTVQHVLHCTNLETDRYIGPTDIIGLYMTINIGRYANSAHRYYTDERSFWKWKYSESNHKLGSTK